MYKLQYDMYDFIDDGVNKSIYTILGEYHPILEKDFSAASLINHMIELKLTQGQVKGFTINYQMQVEELIKLLHGKTSNSTLFVDNGEKVSDEEFNRIFDELKTACADNSDCKFFVTIKEYLEYATKTIADPEKKPLRDAIVTNATKFLSREEQDAIRGLMLKTVYIPKAEEKAREVDHKSREYGKYPEWDKLQAIRKIVNKSNGLKEYDEFYDVASEQIKEAALKAMQKARISTVCNLKRKDYVRQEIALSMPSETKDAEKQPVSEMFDKLKRIPEKDENAWAYESYKKPELLCDLEANYTENGIENQRVIAFRYGKFKYKNSSERDSLYLDRTAEMPELIGISRIGNDGTKTYFVLMPSMDKLTFRPIGESPEDPGEKPFGFTITQDVEVPTRSGRTKIERQTSPAQVVDGKTNEKLNVFINRDIPEHLKDFYIKVYFSDEYLSNAIRSNARYIGSVVETSEGPRIRTSDIGKSDLAAAHYATYHPGTVDRLKAKNFESYCSSSELDIRQYNLINEYERNKIKNQKNEKPKKEDGAR